MGLKFKYCAACGRQKWIGRTKKCCKACRRLQPYNGKKPRSASTSNPPPPESIRSYLPRHTAVQSLGFANYKAYLLSDLWKAIRKRCMDRDGGKCVLCRKPATEVHHNDYSREVLEGRDDGKLASLCFTCHKVVEFDPRGEKRSFERAVIEFQARFRYFRAKFGLDPA